MNYEDLLSEVYSNAPERDDRTGTGTISQFGGQIRYDLSEGFPLITTKFVPFRLVAEEVLWFLRGETNIKSLQEKDVHIWDEWADEDGDIGPMYGFGWRRWGDQNSRTKGIDQIQSVIDSIREDPFSRRHIVSAWNVADLPYMALAPCHIMFQFYVTNDHKLSIQVYQRSADMFLGNPFNLASYALLTHMIAHLTGLGVGELIWTGGDVHIYQNHMEQVEEQLSRQPYDLPQLKIRRTRDTIDEFEIGDFELIGYEHHPRLTGKVAV